MHGRFTVMSAPRKYPEELRGWAARRAEGVVPAPGRDSQTSSKDPRLLSFFDAFAYALAYLLVISALVCIDNPLPVPTTVHGLRGHPYVRHRASCAGIPDESRRTVDRAERCRP